MSETGRVRSHMRGTVTHDGPVEKCPICNQGDRSRRPAPARKEFDRG